MAASLDRLSPSEAFSAPDENEFPFGYPAHICQDSPPSKYLCCSCQNVLRRAQQTLCGHRYCAACLSWIVRSSKNPICQKCKEEDPQVVSEESLLTEEKAFSDAAINKEISELNVHCLTLGCSWTGLMKNFEDHQAVCDCALIPCHAGCGLMIMRKKLPDHLENGCAKSPTTCLKCKQTFCSMEYQKHVCQGSSCKDPKETSTETGPEDKPGSAASRIQDGCPFSVVGCSFRQGSREKVKEHEKSSVVMHLGLLLQAVNQTKANEEGKFQASPHLPASERKLKHMERSLSDLQIQGAVEVNGDLEVDCFHTISSDCEEELALQRFMREKLISDLEEKLHVFENIVAVLNKEVESSNMAIAASVHQSELDRDMILRLEQRVLDLHQTLAQKDLALARLKQSLQFSELASYDGIYLWKITDFSRKCRESLCGRTTSLFSPVFYTARYGYKVCLRVYLNGDGTGKGTHISLFFVIMKGEYDSLLQWPFRNKVTFMLLDQNNREHVIDAFRPDLNSASFQKPQGEMNVASGCPMFFPLNKLQSPKHAYVKDDTLFLKCIIETNS
ncbi:TNF receptor-associated factor 1-like [Tachyglossus aculeatus]|uniref:TNF receptor-associated factor 1-like n=1 Tax=Tachyglossus aculeatus TaxID=9261 RepID=UPI0018F67CF8|nr:TNF receptor-associated factor 1-like [Tachyglossus aculeatus]